MVCSAEKASSGVAGVPADPRRWWVLVVLCVSLLMFGLDITVLNVALPTLVYDLHASTAQLQWIVDAYSLVQAGVVLATGSLADRIGAKATFLAGLAVFVAGSAAAAYSITPDRLMMARGVMGLGAALIMPSTLSVLRAAFPDPAERARAIGIWSGAVGVGIAIGPLAGGWLLGHFWWGSVFLINVPIGLAGMIAGAWLVSNRRTGGARRAGPARVALSAGGLGVLLWAIIEAPVRGWGDTGVLVAFALGGLALAGFVSWQRRSSHPLLPFAIFAHRRLAAGNLAVLLSLFALIGGLFLVVQYLQFVLGYSAEGTGLRLAPAALVILVAGPASSLLAERVGARVVIATGFACSAAALALLATTSVHNGYPRALVALVLLGVGAGFTIGQTTDAIVGSLPEADLGVGSATNSASVEIGGALGVAVIGSIAATRYAAAFHHSLRTLPAGLGRHLHGQAAHSVGAALAVASRLPTRLCALVTRAARDAFVAGMHPSMGVATAVAAAGALTALALFPRRRPGPSERSHPPATGPGRP
ncbi:MAG: MFS transporter [Acidimicrobiales bacterium]